MNMAKSQIHCCLSEEQLHKGQARLYLVVDESSHSFDLQHVGLMCSELMHKTVGSSVIPTDTNTQDKLISYYLGRLLQRCSIFQKY